MICQREKDMTTSIEDSYKNAIQKFAKKSHLKKLKHKMKTKNRLELYSKNCFARYTVHLLLFFFKWFLKIVCGTTSICVGPTTFCFKN